MPFRQQQPGARVGSQRERSQRSHRNAEQLHGRQSRRGPRLRRQHHPLREHEERQRGHRRGRRI